MKPSTLPIRVRPPRICQLCDFMLERPMYQRRFLATKTLQAPIRRPVPRLQRAYPSISVRSVSNATTTQKQQPNSNSKLDPETQAKYAEIHSELKDAEHQIQTILSSPVVPTEATVVKIILKLGKVATDSIMIQAKNLDQPSPATAKQSSAASILSLDEEVPPPKPAPASPTELPTPSHIHELAYTLVKHPTVFLSANVLRLYVQLHALIRRPQSIPEIFHLFATKGMPIPGSNPPKYKKSNPQAAKSAVPTKTADTALDAAIKAKNMGLALDIIDASYATKAYWRQKIWTRAVPPGGLAVITPFMLYELCQELSLYSPAMDPDLLANYAFTGFMAYTLFTGTLAYVALTTWANDHMDRVIWFPGTKLYERWLREEERWAIDRVAQAWGFKEKWRRGEEEGEDWEGLKEWCLLKGMILDKVELMEGMQ